MLMEWRDLIFLLPLDGRAYGRVTVPMGQCDLIASNLQNDQGVIYIGKA